MKPSAITVPSNNAIRGREKIARTTFEDGLTALRPFGKMILYGAASGQPEPLVLQSLAGLGSLYVQRPTLRTHTRTAELLRERASAVFALIADGKLDVRIGKRYPLAEARQALSCAPRRPPPASSRAAGA